MKKQKCDPKKEFLKNEFLTLSIQGALQRAEIYKTTKEKERECFQNELRKKLKELGEEYKLREEYNKPINGDEHIENIKKLARELTEKYGDYLKGDKFRIGIAQKALNLYLKYLWCAGFISMPPHCPFDRIIIDAIKKNGVKLRETNWTKIDNIDTYKKWVEAARKAAKDKSIAEWELETWSESKKTDMPRINIKSFPANICKADSNIYIKITKFPLSQEEFEKKLKELLNELRNILAQNSNLKITLQFPFSPMGTLIIPDWFKEECQRMGICIEAVNSEVEYPNSQPSKKGTPPTISGSVTGVDPDNYDRDEYIQYLEKRLEVKLTHDELDWHIYCVALIISGTYTKQQIRDYTIKNFTQKTGKPSDSTLDTFLIDTINNNIKSGAQPKWVKEVINTPPRKVYKRENGVIDIV